MFHPSAPHILFTASRKSNIVRAYDLRYVGRNSTFESPPPACRLGEFLIDDLEETDEEGALRREVEEEREEERRHINTQQRLFFDVGGRGRMLVAGGRLGHLSAWDVTTPEHGLGAPDGSSTSQFGQIARDGDEIPRCHDPIRRSKLSQGESILCSTNVIDS